MRGGRTLERLVTDWKWERREQELWSLTLPFCLEGSDGKQWRLGKVGHWNETEWMKWWGKSLTEIRVPGGIGPWWTPWRSMDFIQENLRIPRWLSAKESTCQGWRWGFHPWVGKITSRRKWQMTPAFLPGKEFLQGQRSLAGYSSCGHNQTIYRLNNNSSRTQEKQEHFMWTCSFVLAQGKSLDSVFNSIYPKTLLHPTNSKAAPQPCQQCPLRFFKRIWGWKVRI